MKGKRRLMYLIGIVAGLFGSEAIVYGEGIFLYKAHTAVLDNQFKIIIIPMDNPGLVSYYSVVRTGSRDEYEQGHTGFAHFFEHMMFRGTKNYPAQEYDRIMTEIGADANAFTSDDITCYHLNFAKVDLETVIKLESDRFQNLDYGEQEFKTEAGAVLGEYLKSLSSPWQHLGEKMAATAFLKHTYRHTTIGFKEDIEAMPTMHQYSLNFYNRYYRPENVVLLITGDVEAEATLQLLKKYYNGWQKGYQLPQITPEPEQTMERRAMVDYPGKSLPIVTVGYKVPAFNPTDRDVASLMLLSDLAFGETSEIYKKLVLQEQRVQFIDSNMPMSRDPKLFTVRTMIQDEKDIENIIKVIDETIAHFQQNLITQQQLTDQQKHNRYRFLMNLDTPENVSGQLVRFVAETGGIEAVDELYAQFEAVTTTDIKRAAEKYLLTSRRTIVTLKGGQ